ncbi:phosphate acetyltransferase [Salmonella enterica subsp. enterica]|uniref:Phosphate acetyltransferase n=1 Tax=Salmonella enterica I TaxID=59201 RepID=A0A379W666_SALET|nr:phosphate acetyltransferase [Salmonella enterica subsp. enterica]
MTHERIEKVQEYVANYVNAEWIESLTATSERSRRLSLRRRSATN